MATVKRQLDPLVAGDTLSRDEFLLRWEAMPEVKKAELIRGVVYMPSPLSLDHAFMNARLCHWLSHYAMHTPGCASGSNATWLMARDAPQPDAHLQVLPDYGGHSRPSGRFPHGAPELAAEVCLSSTSYDLHQKLELYRGSGVDEYLAVLLSEREVRWHRLEGNEYRLLPVSADQVVRSIAFPGLWLNVPALLGDRMIEVIEWLDRGIQAPDHAEFLARLSKAGS